MSKDQFVVRCPDGAIRHKERFDSRDEAARWVEYGHACLTAARHTIQDAVPTYTVPGAVTVHYDQLTATVEVYFTPHGGGAGYFGPCAVPYSGFGPFDEDDLDDSESPFWHAIQQELSASDGQIAWVE